jgi:transcriptional regulator of heat shock response
MKFSIPALRSRASEIRDNMIAVAQLAKKSRPSVARKLNDLLDRERERMEVVDQWIELLESQQTIISQLTAENPEN